MYNEDVGVHVFVTIPTLVYLENGKIIHVVGFHLAVSYARNPFENLSF